MPKKALPTTLVAFSRKITARKTLFLALLLSVSCHGAFLFVLTCNGGAASGLRISASPVKKNILIISLTPFRQIPLNGAISETSALQNTRDDKDSIAKNSSDSGQQTAAPSSRIVGTSDPQPASNSGYYPNGSLTLHPYPLTEFEVSGIENLDGIPLTDRRIILRVWLDQRGMVANIETETNTMPEVFHEAAVTAFRKMRFHPGEINGQPVGSILRIEITADDFRLPAQ